MEKKEIKNKTSDKKSIWRNPNWDYLFFALFAVFLLYFANSKLANEDDVFWHLATGKYIVNNGSVPSTDIFSFPTQGQQWIPFEWGWDIVVYKLNQGFGYWGMYGFNFTLLCLFFWLNFLILKGFRAGNGLILLYFPVLCLGMFERLSIRPHTVSYLFFVLLIYILCSFRYFKRGNFRGLYFVPLIFLIWVNMHMGAIAGITLLGLFVLFEILAYYKPEVFLPKDVRALDFKELKKVILIGAASVAVMFINPHGYQTFVYVASHLGMKMMENVSEWAPPTQFIFMGMIYNTAYFVLLALGLTILYYSIKKKDYFPLLLYVVFGANSLRAIRYTVDYIIVVAPFIIISISYMMDGMKKDWLRKLFSTNVIPKLVISAVLVYAFINIPDRSLYKDVFHYPKSFGVGMDTSFFPTRMVDFMNQNKITELSSKPFNSYEFGGYFLWNFPGKQNFIDSRGVNDFIMSEYDTLFSIRTGFENIINQYDFEYAFLVERDLLTEPQLLDQFIYKYFYLNSNTWKLVYWDDNSMLFLKDIPKFHDLISKYEYKYMTPYNLLYQQKIIESGLNKENVQQIFKEMSRKALEDNRGVIIHQMYKSYEKRVNDLMTKEVTH